MAASYLEFATYKLLQRGVVRRLETGAVEIASDRRSRQIAHPVQGKKESDEAYQVRLKRHKARLPRGTDEQRCIAIAFEALRRENPHFSQLGIAELVVELINYVNACPGAARILKVMRSARIACDLNDVMDHFELKRPLPLGKLGDRGLSPVEQILWKAGPSRKARYSYGKTLRNRRRKKKTGPVESRAAHVIRSTAQRYRRKSVNFKREFENEWVSFKKRDDCALSQVLALPEGRPASWFEAMPLAQMAYRLHGENRFREARTYYKRTLEAARSVPMHEGRRALFLKSFSESLEACDRGDKPLPKPVEVEPSAWETCPTLLGNVNKNG